MSYIGQTIRTVELLGIEHKRYTHLQKPKKSAVAEHCLGTGHRMEYNNTEILACISIYWDSDITEALEIKLASDLINRDGGFCLNSARNTEVSRQKQRTELIAASPTD